VIGALGIGRRIAPAAAPRAVVLGTLASGAGIGLAALAPSLLPALAAFALGGAGNGTGNVAMRTLIHARVPDAVRGRAYGGYSGAATGADFAALASGGPLVEALGPRGTFGVAGVGTLAASLVGLLRLPRTAR
jgi:MFS family permease